MHWLVRFAQEVRVALQVQVVPVAWEVRVAREVESLATADRALPAPPTPPPSTFFSSAAHFFFFLSTLPLSLLQVHATIDDCVFPVGKAILEDGGPDATVDEGDESRRWKRWRPERSNKTGSQDTTFHHSSFGICRNFPWVL